VCLTFRPASGFPLAGLVVLVVPGNLVMPSGDSPTVDSVHGGSAQCGQRPGGRRLALLALELQVGGKAHRIDAVLLNRFLVAGGEFGVVFIAGARGVVNVL